MRFSSSHKHRIQTLVVLMGMGALCLQACEVHDYWLVPADLEVDGSVDHAESTKLETDLFVRYQIDYAIQNTSSEASEVVVSGTSFVNNIERTTGLKVWRLEPDEYVKGILTTTQLQYGNSLQVSLSCCNQSACYKSEVLCPDEANASDVETNALFCYNACKDTTKCVQKCPAEQACIDFCENQYATNSEEYKTCLNETCFKTAFLPSCEQYCDDDDEACLTNCQPSEACAQQCASTAVACFKNCISTWSLCNDEPFENISSIVPCSLCDDGKHELAENPKGCKYNPEMPAPNEHDEIINVLTDGETTYQCPSNYDCDHFPAICLTDCEKLFKSGSDTIRMNCLDQCVQQHLLWCNDFELPSEYIDTRYKQPCCYQSACNASMASIVKTLDVQCFNDTSCSSDHYCSDEGVCVESGASNCSQTLAPKSGRAALLVLLTTLVALTCRRRRHEVHP